MKRIKEWNLLFVLLLSLLGFSCSSDPNDIVDPDDPDIPVKERTFTASLEDVESRVYVEDGQSARWTKDDKISLFDSNTLNTPYLFAGNTGDSSGKFQLYSKPVGTGTTLNANYAVYPYDSNIVISGNGVITLTLPSKQHYAENSFGLGDNTLVAVTSKSDDTNLKFRNVCGYYKILLYDEDLTVKSITLTGNDGEKIAGKAQVTAEYNKMPVVTMASDASTSITLDCGTNGVKVGSTLEEATAFWMAVPPTVFEKGVTLKVTDINGNETVQTTDKQVVVERNVANKTTKFKDNHYAVFHDDNGWDESVYFGNGSQIHMKRDEETGYVKNIFAWAVDSKNELHPVVSEMDEQGMPSKITYGNMEIFVTRYDETTLDMTLFVDNEFVFQADSITHGLTFSQESRAWADNNSFRNAIAVVQLVAATIEIAASGTGIVAGVASGQLWAAGLAGVTLVSGIADFKEAYDVLFSEPQPANDDFSFLLKNYSDGSIDLGKELKNPDSNFYKMLYENKSIKDLNLKPSDFKGLVSLVLSIVDKIWGESYNSAEQIEKFKKSVFLSAPIPEEVKTTSARLSAIYSYYDNGGVTNINMIPGMRYHKTDEPSAFVDLWDPYGSDELHYYFKLENLEKKTKYTCRAFYHETGHDWYFFGDKTTFTTKSVNEEEAELREVLIKLYNQTDGDNWTNNKNWCSDEPITKWYGVRKDEIGKYVINLYGNNLTGKIGLTFPDEVVWLDCSNNQLTSLNVSGSTALVELNCPGNQLTSLNASGCTALKRLDCYDNQLTFLDVSGCTSLTDFIWYQNPLTTLNASGCTSLTEIFQWTTQLTSLDVSGCTALETLCCEHNQLISLNVSGCTALKWLDCSGNQLTSLDVSQCTALVNLSCSGNQLTSLDVSRCTALEGLSCGENQLTSLDVSLCTALEYLACNDSPLTSLNFSGCTALKELWCDGSQLTSLNVSGYTALESLDCHGLQLTSLNVSGCTALKFIKYGGCQITSLDVSGCTALESLDCDDLQLTSLNVSGCTALKSLNCKNNQLTSLDVSGLTALEGLDCRNNKINSVIPDWFSQLKYFNHDMKYRYWEEWSYVLEEYVIKYETNDYGWWYPGEPRKGYHDRD